MSYLSEVPLYCTRGEKTEVRLWQKKPFLLLQPGHPLGLSGLELTPPCLLGWLPQPSTHLPRVPLPLGCSFIHFQSGWASSPLTSILLYMSNFTP